MFKAAGVQPIEVGPTVLVGADHFAIEYCVALEPCRLFHNARIALGPVGRIHRVEANTPRADMHLQPIAVCLTSCTQRSPVGGCFERVGREGWMKPGGASLDR